MEGKGIARVWLLLAGLCAVSAWVLALCVLHRLSLPANVGRALGAEEARAVIGRNSPLTSYVHLSPNADFPREGTVSKITIHHMAGDLTLEELGASFSREDRRASSNYGIDSQGRVALYVEERNRAWTSSSRENEEMGGEWRVSDQAYESLLELCADICRRNDIPELRFTGDETGSLTLHSMFQSETECPGPYLERRMGEIARAVNRQLEE